MRRIFFDTETTGLLKPSPAGLATQPYITELYLCKTDQHFNILEEYESRFKIPVPLPDFITRITKITEADLENCPEFSEESEAIKAFIEDADETVAHNHNFDKSMVLNEFIRAGYTDFDWPAKEVCTVQLSMPLEQRRINLQKLHEHMLGKGFADAHSAKADVHAVIRCFHKMQEKGMVI